MRWIVGVIGALVVIAAPLAWAYVVALACAFGSVNGNCPPVSEGFLNLEAAIWFWIPWALGIWLIAVAIWLPRAPRFIRLGLWVVPVLLIVTAWAISRPIGFFAGQPALVDIGLENYHDHPVVVMALTLNDKEVFLPRPEVVRSAGDLQGPRWGASQALRRPWPLATDGRIEVSAEWVDLRTGVAWKASGEGALDQMTVREGWGSGPLATLGLVFVPDGALVVASDALTATGAWVLTPIDLIQTCGWRTPESDRLPGGWPDLNLDADRRTRLMAPAQPPTVPTAAALHQPGHSCTIGG